MLFEIIKRMEIGVSYGSGALKALQNDTLPELDLLVREAIQNSSDASINIKNEDSFAVNFNVGAFCPERFNANFPSIQPVLDKRFSGRQAQFLEIRDYKTEGLTGFIRVRDIVEAGKQSNCDVDHGNYFKLVFDTGKEQSISEAGEAGGSWGYGKSVYYRVGIGLVVFYSRIKDGESFEERMIIGLTEHENPESSLLKTVASDSIGRAWWGKEDPEDPEGILPITDPDEIEEILETFNLQRFKANQTGTSIIIPYIDEEKLLHGLIPEDSGISDEEKTMCFWKDSLTDYIELAVQKWYAPKIFNKNLKSVSSQKWLAVRINGKPITNDTMRPLFQLVQELYTTALYKCNNATYSSGKYSGIKTVQIPSQRVEGGKAGYASFIRIKQQQLSPEGMIKPYTYLRLFSKSASNDPIVMFARTPGMVLDYKIDGKWTKGLTKPEEDDEYIFAFFVPSCSLKLKNDKSLGLNAGKTLGEYLRSSEKSDHMDWTDTSSLTVIANIKNQVVNKINTEIKLEIQPVIEGTMSRLSGKLGKALLPTLDYGKKSKSRGAGGSGGGSGALSDNLIIDLKQQIRADCMLIDFTLTFKNTRKSMSIGVFVETENGVIDANTWEADLKTDYPIQVHEISNVVINAQNSGDTKEIYETCNKDTPKVENDFSSVELLFTKSGRNTRGFRVDNHINNAVVSGRIMLKTYNRKCVCTIKEIKND